MTTGLVDSGRHAAFELGYNGRLLRDACATLRAGGEPIEIDGILDRLERAAFVLLDDDTPYRSRLERVATVYYTQADLDLEGASFSSEPGGSEPLRLLLDHELDRLESLGCRGLRVSAELEAWHQLGSELADLTLLCISQGEEPELEPLVRALSRLSGWDRFRVTDMFPVGWDSALQLASGLRGAYESILELLAAVESTRSQAGRPMPAEEVPTACPGSGGTLIKEVTGLQHDDDFSLCMAKGVAYHPSRIVRPLIRSLNHLLLDGITHTRWDDLVERAISLETDAQLVKELRMLKLKEARVIFKDGNVWRTLVVPLTKPKGHYRLDL